VSEVVMALVPEVLQNAEDLYFNYFIISGTCTEMRPGVICSGLMSVIVLL
jgi:hypothetical protein